MVTLPRRMTFLSLVAANLALITLASPGCNDRETKTYPIWQPDLGPPTRTYSTSPESTSELLRDASQATTDKIAGDLGVHFTLLSSGVVSRMNDSTRGEGDLVFPDKVQMAMRDYLSPMPVNTNVIVADGRTYINSEATGGAWQAGSAPSPPPDPRLITRYLDFARSSRNFGQETLTGDRKTYHVQVDVDMPLLTADLIMATADPLEQEKFETMKSSVVTVDFWIDMNDRLVYQMLVKSSNQAQGHNLEQNFVFSNWGEPAEIVRPCESC